MRSASVPALPALLFLSAQTWAGDSLLDEALVLVRLGGPVVIVLFAMSVIALAISLYKTWQLRRIGGGGKRVEASLDDWARGDADAALDALGHQHDAIAAMMADGMRWLREGRDAESVREELARRADRELSRAESMLGVLEQVSYLAPLLGLLGTVLGIIDVFQGLAMQGADSSAGSLAGGIWEALLTTAVGLCVAIPFALVHSLLDNQVEQLRKRLEDRLTRLFTAGLQGNS